MVSWSSPEGMNYWNCECLLWSCSSALWHTQTQDSVACGRIVEAGWKWDSTERAGPHAANHLGPIRWIWIELVWLETVSRTKVASGDQDSSRERAHTVVTAADTPMLMSQDSPGATAQSRANESLKSINSVTAVDYSPQQWNSVSNWFIRAVAKMPDLFLTMTIVSFITFNLHSFKTPTPLIASFPKVKTKLYVNFWKWNSKFQTRHFLFPCFISLKSCFF